MAGRVEPRIEVLLKNDISDKKMSESQTKAGNQEKFKKFKEFENLKKFKFLKI